MPSTIHPAPGRRPRLLRRLLLAALVACALPAAARAQAPQVPDSPAGRRLNALLALVARDDTVSLRTFVDENMDAQYRAMPFDAHVRALTGMRQQLRGARIVALDAPRPTELRATLDNGGRRFVIDLTTEPAAPNRISGVGVTPESELLPAPERLTADQIREVVDSVAAQVERNYVSPDTGRLIADRLRTRLASGAYASLTRPVELAEALTADLRAQNGDRHLSVQVRTGGGGGGGGGPRGAADSQRRSNYGFSRVERLDGNVGYIKLTGISGAPEAREVALNALRFIANTDAVILDLRGVPGGSAEMANFLISHFTAPNLPSLRVYWRQDDRTEVRNTLAEVPGPRRTDIPLYVLIDRGAGSAAEDIPFVLQNLGRATLVGQRTAGAGRNNGFFPAAHGMSVSVSISRVTDPRTGREWEGTGVKPDLEAPSAQALAAAHADALRKLAAAAPDERRRSELTLTAEYVAAQAKPAAVPAERLATYAGRYENGRVVTVEEGRLYYQPAADAPRLELVPLPDGRFATGPTVRVAFAPGEGGRPTLQLVSPGQPPRVFAKLP
ncbi:MAG TPA: S41 family peptidase [Longimicrobium sp.]|jgi:hypothetical protein